MTSGSNGSACPTGLLVDPFIFATPDSFAIELWLAFFERVEKWSRVLRKVDSSTSDRAVATLRTLNRYATLDVLRDMIKRLGIDSYTAVDIQNALRVLSDRAPYAEERLSVRDTVGSVEVEPGTIRSRLPIEVGNAVANILVAAALYCRDNDKIVPDIGTFDIPSNEVTVRASVDLIEDYNGALVEPTQECIESIFSLVQAPECLLETNWESVCHDPIAATQFIYDTELKKTDPGVEPLGQLVVGPKFAESVRRLSLAGQCYLLKRLYYLVALASTGRLAKSAGAKLHPVRVSVAADADPVIRENGDSLRRCMLTKTGAGFRLHYWTSSSGAIELHEVVVESEV